MDSQEDQQDPDVWKLRAALLSSIDFAEGLARHEPEHAAAVARYSHAIRTDMQQVMNAFETGGPPTWHDVMVGPLAALAMASNLAERIPEKNDALSQFGQEVKEAQDAFTCEVKRKRIG